MSSPWIIPDPDPVSSQFPLVGSPLPVLSILSLYLLMVKVGPRLMEHRKPVDLTRVMLVYNFVLVGVSLYIVMELALAVVGANYNLYCDSYKRTDDPRERRIMNVLWWYFASKGVELLDTLFMVLRKKTKQITFLHMFHHLVMFPVWYVVLKFGPGGAAYFGAFCNSIIHVIMYSYYFLAAVPAARQFLWWKKYLTQLQMAQFLIVLTHTTYLLVQDLFFTACYRPRALTWFLEVWMVTLFGLFLNFYVHEYKKSRDRKAEVRDKKVSEQGENGSTMTEVNPAETEVRRR